MSLPHPCAALAAWFNQSAQTTTGLRPVASDLNRSAEEMKTSLTKIIWNDWPALFSACAIPLVWIIHFAFPYLKRNGPPPLGFTIGLSCLAAVALAWRVARVQKLFSSGGKTDGVVEAVRIVKDRGRLEYSYHVGERAFSGWCAVHRSKQVLALRIGEKITVVFDRQRPEKSIVADLFVAP